jgi:hypothetical protein
MGSAIYLSSAWLVLWISFAGIPSPDSTCPRLVIADRQAWQHNGQWTIRYQLEYRGERPEQLSAHDVGVDYAAWVANSRCRSHAVPRRSLARATADEGPAVAMVIDSPNERARCRERISLCLTSGAEPSEDRPAVKASPFPFELARGRTTCLYVTLEHDHFLHGNYDPLLGERDLVLHIGSCRLHDTVVLDAEQAPAMPRIKLSTPPRERMDARQYHSAPDSLYLAADMPGYQYFRFDDMPVRYGTSFRLRFWYLIAVGSEGSCHARVMEYQDTPNAWYRLDGGFDEALPSQGRWERFEQTFHTLRDTTTIALDFRIIGANVGELWIDDIELEPLYADSGTP